MTFYADLVRKGWAAFVRGWKLVLCATFLSILPALVQNVLTWTGVLTREPSSLWLILPLTFCSLLFVPGITIIWLRLLRGERAGLRDLREGLRFLGRFLSAELLFFLMLSGLLLVFVIPFLLSGAPRRDNLVVWLELAALLAGFLWLSCLYGLFPKTAVDQDVRGPVAVLCRSRELTRGHRWRFLGLNVFLSALILLPYPLLSSTHPGVIALRMVLTFAINVLNPMLTSAFYEAIRSPRAEESDLQETPSPWLQGDDQPLEKASAAPETKFLPVWYSRLYRRRLTICLWLLVAACVLYLAPAVLILDSITVVQVLGCLYYPGLAFFLWTGLKALSDDNRGKAIGTAILYLVWYAVFQLISAEGDFRLLRLMASSYFLTSAFLAGVAFLVHTLCAKKKLGFIPFIVVALLCLSDLSACITGIPNFLLMKQYHLMEEEIYIVFYCCQLLAALLLTSAFAVGMFPARFGSRVVEGAEEASGEPEDEDDAAEDEESDE
ncbi:MAG: hypothetical protein IKE08_00630 [Clostridia bacterium]|nr:hypothetical protein [Clostridia bacterium]